MPLWKPSNISDTNIFKFMKYVNQKRNTDLQTYEQLHEWSVGEKTSKNFWKDAYTWLELATKDGKDSSIVLSSQSTDVGNLFPPPRFFPDSKLNIAELILRNGKDEDVAIHFVREGEDGVAKITWAEIREQVRRLRGAMLSSGVEQGDVVAAVISNSVYAVCLCLATLSVGAVWSSSSPDLGPEGIVDRYSQVNPKLIFADDGYTYAGKLVNLQERIIQWSEAISQNTASLQKVIIIPYCNLRIDWSRMSFASSFENFLECKHGPSIGYQLLSFSHPAFILFSSGTTGKPKCIVHSAGGAALKVRTDSILQHDIRKDDIVFQYTTTSWVMWVLNFLNLGVGSSMLLYDGSPFHPSPTILLQLAQDVGVSVFGTSPRYLADLRSRGIVPREQFNLNKLRTVTSTGAVLSTELYEWFYREAFPPQAQLISMSGGTDIAGSFVGGTAILPVYAGEIQVKALGMAVDIMDAERKKPISIERSGSVGELVCIKPFPSQPLAFLGQDGMEKYRTSYFTRYGSKIWCQGDLVQRFLDTGGIAMLGRSDGILNPSGVRFGSAEIYAVTDTFPEIKDSICVGQRRDQDPDERVLLFVTMKDGLPYTSELEQKLKDAIRQRYTHRHVPEYIFEVADIPYTTNGKKCEINVKHTVCGRDMAVSGTVANPEALALYKTFQSLPSDQENRSRRRSKL
ncbi:acetoacetyl-synthase [Pyrenochaeta sp. MPI-SDFR-AT-0127]|nr:acetoacetyl-synthase [Pyrenochaeta sp. MPI-SDFR-AT-0127]